MPDAVRIAAAVAHSGPAMAHGSARFAYLLRSTGCGSLRRFAIRVAS